MFDFFKKKNDGKDTLSDAEKRDLVAFLRSACERATPWRAPSKGQATRCGCCCCCTSASDMIQSRKALILRRRIASGG